MRILEYVKNIVVITVFGAVLMIATAGTINAQSESKEYRDWQRAQARAEQEHRDYLRTRSSSDYRQWQDAERRVEEQYRQYQRTANRYDRDRDNGSVYNSNNNNNGRFRVRHDGSEYWTDTRGADLLRQAVRNGYAEGYRQGEIDKRGRRPYDFTLGTEYRNGTYGYQSYVERNQYQYYFQQGFQRGYEDGFNNTSRYGNRSGNGFTILGNILDSILDIGN